ncbi:DNA polymerase III subunit beta [Labrenzia sp. THAF35]|uniref:hypothetical protein n=1 Tax=Labrenzia sp. THAF35 TaxID=2587854 RepID=UPI001267CB38|nr:hypothetical protein [Labrenzia sp. THAF35]QFT69326.1 DNA polymerase III subunit beta [Labrenzia sp. THAF35]
MLIETTAGELKTALDALKPVIYRRNCIPVLGAVLLKDGAVTGTNLDLEIRIKFAAKRFEGSAAIPFFQLLDLVGGLPQKTKLRLQDTDRSGYGVFVTFAGGRYYLPSYPAEDFPEWTVRDDDLQEMASPDGLLEALKTCQPFISTEETRYYLNGVCFSRDQEGNGVIVATTGHHLIAYQYAHDCQDNPILPRLALPALLGLAQPERVMRGEKQMVFHLPGGNWLKSKLIDGTYPAWTRVVPDLPADAAELKISPREFLGVLGRMKLASRNGSWRAVDICANASGDLVVVTCKGSDGEECAERLDKGTAENWSRMANSIWSASSTYLMEICRLNRKADELVIRGTESNAPVYLSHEGSKALIVLMPVRNGNEFTRKSLLTLARSGDNDADAAAQVA